jgi:hypothetical protein
MEGLIFLCFLLLVAVFLAVAAKKNVKTTVENFQPLVIPTPGPPPQPILAGQKAKPYNPPSAELLTAPFGETSDVTSRPFQDPALDKAPYSRLYELLQDMNAFHDFEEEKLTDRSDPAIALPLTTFKGDRQRLIDEVAFLNRNPGLQSTLTIGDVQGFRVNLTYLQKKARQLRGGAIDLSAPIDLAEGFADATNEVQPAPRATQAELEDATTRIGIEIARLQASGTTDPVFAARINILSKINAQLGLFIQQLKNKTLLPADVPLTSKDLKDFLPVISDPSKPVDRFLSSIQAPAVLTNLFPSYQVGDISGAQLANSVFKAYGDAVFKGLSWDLNLKYTSQNDLLKAREVAQAKKQAQVGAPFELGTMPEPRGAFERAITELETNSKNPGARPTFPEPNTAKFNWKERSSQICEAIRMQGLDPADFGCLKNTSKVGDDFSWRGYAKMVCTRLQTTMDPGLPDACGCPPVGWPGWRQ